MSVSLPLDAVIKMLENCAKGYSIALKTHFRIVRYNSKTFPSLPKAKDIEIGHVRQMVRHLEIDKECANGHFKTLLFKLVC